MYIKPARFVVSSVVGLNVVPVKSTKSITSNFEWEFNQIGSEALKIPKTG